MLRVFNMGVGMVLIVAQDALRELLGSLRESGERGSIIGSVAEGGHGVVYDFPAGGESSDGESSGGEGPEGGGSPGRPEGMAS
jgi:hypothetical protein